MRDEQMQHSGNCLENCLEWLHIITVLPFIFQSKNNTVVKTSDVTTGWAVMYAGNAVVALGWIHS